MFRKARQNSLVEDMVAQIEEAIVKRTLKPGDKLPSLQELLDMLGTSRGTLREALRILKQKGLVEVRLGAKGGVFVKESTTEPVAQGLALLIRQRNISLDDLAEFRGVVESGLIRLVIEKATKSDIDELKQFLLEFQVHVKKGSAGWHGFLEAEVRLRKALIQIAANRMYEAVLLPIHENIFAYAQSYLPGDKANVKEAYHDWCQIIDALEKHDAATAVSVTQDHIFRYARYMKQGKDESARK